MKIQNTEEQKQVKSVFNQEGPEDVEEVKLVKSLKKKHKRVYMTEVAGERGYGRPLKRSEYREMMNIEFPEGTSDEDIIYERENFIAEHVILHPEGITEEIALVAVVISTLCMLKSGFEERNNYSYKEV